MIAKIIESPQVAGMISFQLLCSGNETAVEQQPLRSGLSVREREDYGRVDILLPGIGIVITLSMGIWEKYHEGILAICDIYKLFLAYSRLLVYIWWMNEWMNEWTNGCLTFAWKSSHLIPLDLFIDISYYFECCYNSCHVAFFIFTNNFFLQIIYLFILEREEGREKERERSINVWEKHQCVVASHMPPTGDMTWPATQVCALTGNPTGNPWFAGRHSIHWATQARAQITFVIYF